MCTTRSWLKLYSEESAHDLKFSYVYLIGERSDYEVFKIILKLDGNDNLRAIAEKVKRGFETLESYRNCDCSIQAGECIKHLTSINTNLPTPAISVTNFRFGRKSI